MPLAVHLAGDLEVIFRQHFPALTACKAPRMEFPRYAPIPARAAGLKVLALNAAIAAMAQRSVFLVVVLLAEWLVGDDVEVGRGERLFAGAADEAGFVPAASQAAVGCFDRLAFDD